MMKMYHVIYIFTHSREFIPEIVPLWPKNQNQHFHAKGLIWGGGVAYTWSNTIVKEKMDLSLGRGTYRQRNTVFIALKASIL